MRTNTFSRLNNVLLALSLAVLGACGGGSGGTADATATTTPTTPTTPTVTDYPAGGTLSGVAATGAPLLSASVKVVDADGTLVGSGTTSPVDGVYRLVPTATAPKVPLLIQVAGVDAAGNPVVLHSLLQSGTLPLIANVTPATNAVVAMVLGADPQAVFLAAAANTDALQLLGNTSVVAAAATQFKTIVKSSLTDGKITNTTTLDLFQDSAFVANKAGLDGALEGLRLRIVKNSAGSDLLQLGNKFALPGVAEVTVNLATAKTELTKTTGGNVANAITSTVKTTTSPSATVTALTVIDDLAVAVNKLIAQGASSATFSTSTLLASYTKYNGRTKTNLADKFAAYATSNYQLSKLQVTGCVEVPVAQTGCVKVRVAAIVTDAAGQQVEVFNDAVSYSKTSTPNWVFVGNGFDADVAVAPVAFATYDFNGVLTTGTTANPVSGVQVMIGAIAGDTSSKTVQIPSGHAVSYANCGLGYLCVKTSTSAAPVATGELKDLVAQQLTLGTIGNLDAVASAKYLVTSAGTTVYAFPAAYLPADVPSNLSTAPFPMLDALATTPLTAVDVAGSAGPTLSWANWAAAHPNMRMFLVRILAAGGGAYASSDATLPPGLSTGVAVPALTIPTSLTPTEYQVWLGAQDSLGRRYYSKFTSAP